MSSSKYLFISLQNALMSSPIVIVGDGYIEVPGIVIYVNSKWIKFMFKFISINSKIIVIEDPEEYALMVSSVFSEKIGVLLTSRRGIMKEVVRVNIIAFTSALVKYKETENTIVMNDIYFSSSFLNFHGLGMFSGLGRKVFLLNKKELDRLKVASPRKIVKSP